jgi:hypothetical protein
MARRFSASAWKRFLSASAWSAWSGADVLAHVDVGDVDREDLEGRAGVEPAGHHGLGDVVGVLEHMLVRLGRADGGDDALAHAGDDGLLGRAADEALRGWCGRSRGRGP